MLRLLLLFTYALSQSISAYSTGTAECATKTTFNGCRTIDGCIWVNGEKCTQCATNSTKTSCPEDGVAVFVNSVSQPWKYMVGDSTKISFTTNKILPPTAKWSLSYVADIHGGGYQIQNTNGQVLTANAYGFIDYTSSGDASTWCFPSDGKGNHQVMNCETGAYWKLDTNALYCLMTEKEASWTLPMDPSLYPTECHVHDSDQCLQQTDRWGPGQKWTCSNAASYCNSWPKDLHRCCPETCGVGYLSESACNALDGDGSCDYPNQAQKPCAAGGLVETTCAEMQFYFNICFDSSTNPNLYKTVWENCPATCGYQTNACAEIGCTGSEYSAAENCNAVFAGENGPLNHWGAQFLADSGQMGFCDEAENCCANEWWQASWGATQSCSKGCQGNTHASAWGRAVCPSTCARQCNAGPQKMSDFTFTLPNMYATDAYWSEIFNSAHAFSGSGLTASRKITSGHTKYYKQSFSGTIGAKFSAKVSGEIGAKKQAGPFWGVSGETSFELSGSLTRAMETTTTTSTMIETTINIPAPPVGTCLSLRQVVWKQTDKTDTSLNLLAQSPDYCEVSCDVPLGKTGKTCRLNPYSGGGGSGGETSSATLAESAVMPNAETPSIVYAFALVGLGAVLYGSGKYYTKSKYTMVVDTTEV